MTASADVEGQSESPRSRSRCLDTFLTASVIALFVLFAVALAGALWFAKHIESEINARNAPRADGSADSLIGRLPDAASAYKMQNFAYLRANESELKNKNEVMAWESIPYGSGFTVGSLFSYDAIQKALTVHKSGSYFLYVQLRLFCSGVFCPAGQFTVSFKNREKVELTCTVSLPKRNGTEPVSRTCWQVVTFPENGDRLIAKSQFQGTLGHWQLDMNGSGFGMFLVDGAQAAHHT